MTGMTMLITGAGGFLGAWAIRRFLARGISVRVLDSRDDRRLVRDIAGLGADDLDWRVGDVADARTVAEAARGCTGAVALAGLLTPACAADPVRGAQVNLIGVLNVFEAAKSEGIGFVCYASSAGVYGPHSGDEPLPTTHYGAFKLACEGAARAYHAESGLSSVGLRPFVAYGPGREVGMSAGPTLACRAAARGERYTIPFSGTAGFVYADDVAAAIEEAVISVPSGAHVFNMTGETAEVAEVAAEIRRQRPDAAVDHAGPPLPVAGRLSGPGIETLLPRVPRTSLAEGLAATLAHYSAR
jgi:UDP-glucose 4-epimerase